MLHNSDCSFFLIKQVQRNIGPTIGIAEYGLLFNELLNSLITLKQKMDYKTKVFQKKFVPQSIFLLVERLFL